MDRSAKLTYAKIAKKYEMYDTQIVRELPTIVPTIDNPRIIGRYSQTERRGKWGVRRRWIWTRDAVRIGDLIETPTSAARAYLHAHGLKARRFRGKFKYWDARDLLQQRQYDPTFVIPQSPFDDGFYIDIRRAYFSICEIVGWDLSYEPGCYLIRGHSTSDFPFADNHIARNTLVTTTRTYPMQIAQPPDGRLERSRSSFNELENLQLALIVSDVLHALANLAIDAGALMVATDGYICPSANIARDVQQRIADFGLSSRVKHRGKGTVRHVGSYEIGDFATKNVVTRNATRTVRHVTTFDMEHIRWIQRNLEYVAGRSR